MQPGSVIRIADLEKNNKNLVAFRTSQKKNGQRDPGDSLDQHYDRE